MAGRARGLIAISAVLALASLAPATARLSPAARAVRYLTQRQEASGAFGAVSSADGVAEAVGALVAAGGPRTAVARALDHIATHGPGRARDTAGRAGRIVLGLLAADADPRAHAGTDYITILADHYDELSGEFDETNLYSNALAALAWIAAGEQLPDRARTFALANECSGGGFGWRTACASRADADTTSMVIMLLARDGGAPEALGRARAWLAGARLDDGGYGQPGQPTNANSTGLALAAIAALGEDPHDEPWARGGTDPSRALLSLQTGDGGFRYLASQERSDDYATVQAIPGVVGASWPIGAPPADTGAVTRAPKVSRSASPGPLASSPTAGPTRAAPPSPSARAGVQEANGAVVLGAREEQPSEGARAAAPFAFAGLALAVASGMLAARVVVGRRGR